MNFNVGVNYPSVIMWDGENSRVQKVDGFTHFGFTFQVNAALTEDTTFLVNYHEALNGDRCVPGPAIPFDDVPTCDRQIVPGAQATVTLPAGTTPDQLCAGTVPCREGLFVSITPVNPGVDAEHDQVYITMTLMGPNR